MDNYPEYTPSAGTLSNYSSNNTKNFEDNLRRVQEIPSQFQSVFSQFHNFNLLQSSVLDEVFHTDHHIVVSAPTGSGKTVAFELAIVRLLMNLEFKGNDPSFKIIYVAPMKALCEERLVDWHGKFKNIGVTCISVTGDSEYVDVKKLMYYNIILTTPEKWDSMTRRWKDNQQLVESVKLFLIDEVHLLNENARGSTLEAVVSRMKIIQEFVGGSRRIRFLAVSATIPNVEDIAQWLNGGPTEIVKYFKFSEDVRPVKLTKIVLGYPYNTSPGFSPFKFDIMLNYKLQGVMMKYAEGRPVLIFCSTRKSAEMTAKHITLNLTVRLTPEQQNLLGDAAATVTDTQVHNFLIHGVGCHHAGMLPENRRTVETLFRNGDLPVLVTTSTLAMGVNLPAHLVIIKTTKCYTDGEYRDYSESAILQMTGRAGRPLFDTSAYAVIMTTTNDKEKFEKMINGNHCIESNLHRNLNEHLNSEVVLHTITDLGIAMHWLTSTFLYVRASKNPKHYGLAVGLSEEQIDKKLLEMCKIEINKLAKGGMLKVDETASISPTFLGELMARYYLAFDTMKLLTQINGTEILPRLLGIVSKCKEFSDMYLRVNDKATLNLLNACKNRETIRFPLNGKIKTLDMKINCIIQAVFGNLQITQHSLQNEAEKIMRSGERIVKCMVEYLGSQEYLGQHPQTYPALLNAVILAKCFHARLWENSPYLSRQLPGIGMVMSRLLAGAGKTSLQAILDANPRDLETIMNRKPPLGSNIQDMIKRLPKYELLLDKGKNRQVTLTITIKNAADIEENNLFDLNRFMVLIVGDSSDNILVYERYSHTYVLLNQPIVKLLQATSEQHELKIHLLSDEWVGFDCEERVSFNLSCVKTNPVAEASAGTVNVAKITAKPISKPIRKKNLKTSSKIAKRGQQTGNKGSHVQSFIDRYMKKSKSFTAKTTVQKKKSSGSFEKAKNKSSASRSNSAELVGSSSLLDNGGISKAGPSSEKNNNEKPSVHPNHNKTMNDSDEFLNDMMEENEDFESPATELSKEESEISSKQSTTDETWNSYRNENNNNNNADEVSCVADFVKPADSQPKPRLNFTQNTCIKGNAPVQEIDLKYSFNNKNNNFAINKLKRKSSDENHNNTQSTTNKILPAVSKDYKSSCIDTPFKYANISRLSTSEEGDIHNNVNNFGGETSALKNINLVENIHVNPEKSYISRRNSNGHIFKKNMNSSSQFALSDISNNYEDGMHWNNKDKTAGASYQPMQKQNGSFQKENMISNAKNFTLTDSGIGSVQNDHTVTKVSELPEHRWNQKPDGERHENVPMLQVYTLGNRPKTGYYYDGGRGSSKAKMLQPTLRFKKSKEKLNISSPLDKSIWFEEELFNNEEDPVLNPNNSRADTEATAYPDSTNPDLQDAINQPSTSGRKSGPIAETQKTISWRSPLVYSPGLKYSPHVQRLQKSSSFEKLEQKTSQNPRYSVATKQRVPTPGKPSTIPSTSTSYSEQPLQLSKNGRLMLAVADRDYNIQTLNSTTLTPSSLYYNPTQQEQFHRPSIKIHDTTIPDSLHDFCSNSLLELLQSGNTDNFAEGEESDLNPHTFSNDVDPMIAPSDVHFFKPQPPRNFEVQMPEKNFNEILSQFINSDRNRRSTPSVASGRSHTSQNLNLSQTRSKRQKVCEENESQFRYKLPVVKYHEEYPNPTPNWEDKENVCLNNSQYDYDRVLEDLVPYQQSSFVTSPSQTFERHWSNESVVNAEHSIPRNHYPSTITSNREVVVNTENSMPHNRYPSTITSNREDVVNTEHSVPRNRYPSTITSNREVVVNTENSMPHNRYPSMITSNREDVNTVHSVARNRYPSTITSNKEVVVNTENSMTRNHYPSTIISNREDFVNTEHSIPRNCYPSAVTSNRAGLIPRRYKPQQYFQPCAVPPAFHANTYYRRPLAEIGEQSFMMRCFNNPVPDEIHDRPMSGSCFPANPSPYFRRDAVQFAPKEELYPREQFRGSMQSDPRGTVSDVDRVYMMKRFFDDVSEEDETRPRVYRN